jgi:hypothetical protein
VFRTASLLAFSLVAGTAAAQAPRGVYVPPDVKGYRAHQMVLAHGPRATTPSTASAARPSVRVQADDASSAPVQVTITLPPTAQPLAPQAGAVAIKGPDGTIRQFPVEGGRQTLESRVIVVRPGERATIRVVIGRR